MTSFPKKRSSLFLSPLFLVLVATSIFSLSIYMFGGHDRAKQFFLQQKPSNTTNSKITGQSTASKPLDKKTPSPLSQPRIKESNAESVMGDKANPSISVSDKNEQPSEAFPGSNISSTAAAGHNAEKTVPLELLEKNSQKHLAPSDILHYSIAKPLQEKSKTVGGPISASMAFSPKTSSSADDPCIRAEFIQSLAALLVQHYWPPSSHPAAKYKGISTLSVRHVNTFYGNSLKGLGRTTQNIESSRQRFFRYILTPSMMQRIYELYEEELIKAINLNFLQKQEQAQNKEAYPTAAAAEMYAIYASKLKGLAGSCLSYIHHTEIINFLKIYEQAETGIYETNLRYLDALEAKSFTNKDTIKIANELLNSIAAQEEAKKNIVTLMRKDGKTRGLDGEELLFIAQWLNRRNEDHQLFIPCAAKLLYSCAARFEEEELAYQDDSFQNNLRNSALMTDPHQSAEKNNPSSQTRLLKGQMTILPTNNPINSFPDKTNNKTKHFSPVKKELYPPEKPLLLHPKKLNLH